MRAGQLRHRVELQADGGAENPLGESVENYQTYDTVYARVEPLNGSELQAAQQTHSDVTTRITIRWRDDVLPKHRAKFGDRVYDINAVLNEDERNRRLELLCSESREVTEA